MIFRGARQWPPMRSLWRDEVGIGQATDTLRTEYSIKRRKGWRFAVFELQFSKFLCCDFPRPNIRSSPFGNQPVVSR
jgi:hypothetical protein